MENEKQEAKKYRIRLPDGKEIELFPKPIPQAITAYNEMNARHRVSFREAEYYADIIEKRNAIMEERHKLAYEEQKAAKDVMLRNIKLLYDNADKILSDSRMFLALVPDAGGLAYIGSRIFELPTIGVFLLWWKSCEDAHFMDGDTERWIYCFSGSPLSGMNHCATIAANGKEKYTSVCHFSKMWHSFIEMNRPYQGMSSKCEHYTLEQVVEKLKAEKK